MILIIKIQQHRFVLIYARVHLHYMGKMILINAFKSVIIKQINLNGRKEEFV